MDRSLFLTDRAFMAARPELRKKLGFARTSDVEQCYYSLRVEYDTINQLMLQFDFELVRSKIAYIQARQIELQRHNEAMIQVLFKNWSQITLSPCKESTSTWYEGSHMAPERTIEGNLDAFCSVIDPACSLNLKQHEDVLQSYNRRIHSIISPIAFESRKIQQLLKELDSVALTAFKQLDTFRDEIDKSFLNVREHDTQHTLILEDSDKIASSAITKGHKSDKRFEVEPIGQGKLKPQEALPAGITNMTEGNYSSQRYFDTADSDSEFVFV